MKLKSILLTAVATLGLTTATIAQVTVTISANGSTTICSGNSVQLTGTVSPSAVYQYQWVINGVNITGANATNYTANTSGAYTLKVTDLSSNVYNSNTINVTVNPLPTAPNITYNSPAIICNGGSLNLADNTSTNVSYQWYFNNSIISNGTNSNYNANNSGNYKLVITNLTTGCSNESQVSIGEMPTIIQDTIVTCGTATTIGLTNPNFNYSSLPSSCSVDMSNGNIVNTNIGGNGGGGKTTIICYGGRLTNQGGLNKFVVEYGGTLDFSGGSGLNTVYVKSGGICNITSSGGGGNIIYYEPGAIITPSGLINSVLCNNIGIIYPSNTTALCNNLIYQWSNGALTPTITVNPTVPTTYSVTVSNGSISCTDQVLVNPNGITPTITASGATTFCQGNSVVLTSSSATGNTWSNGATTQSITVSSSGNYSVTVSNGGCSVTSSPTVVTVNPTPATPTITASGATTFCQGSSVVLTSSSATGNTWSNGATTQSITVSSSGNYSVTVSNGSCSVTSSPTVVTVNSAPIVTMSALANFININANSINLNGNPTGGTYSGSGVSGSLFNPQMAGLGSTTINYSYTNTSGCTGNASQSTVVYDTLGVVCTSYDTITTNVFDTTFVTQTIYDTLQVIVYDTLLTTVTDTLVINALITGINPPNNLNTLKVFPNPASTHITIDYGNFNAMSGYTLTIVNSIGQTVFTTPINQQTSYIDLSTWTGNGIYFVQLIDPQNNTIENRKIVIQ